MDNLPQDVNKYMISKYVTALIIHPVRSSAAVFVPFIQIKIGSLKMNIKHLKFLKVKIQ